ncbi:MAG: hypothetical protein WCT07_00055 [Candidatus Paceibacterota bacterium]
MILAVIIFVIGVLITKVTGSPETGSNFVMRGFSYITKPLLWPLERANHKLERKTQALTSTSTSK